MSEEPSCEVRVGGAAPTSTSQTPAETPSPADEIIAKLRGRKTNAVSYLSLVATNGDTVAIEKDLLRQSAFFDGLLKDQPTLNEYRCSASRETLTLFSAYLAQGSSPRVCNSFEAILFGRHIEWDEFIRYCCEASTRIHVPRDAKVTDVAFVVHVLLKHLPLRTFEHYDKLLNTITTRMSPADRDLIIGRMIETIDQKKVGSVDPIPLPLFTKTVTVAIMKDIQNRPMVAILHERLWLPFNVFGPNFCPYTEDVANFHLSFGRYVVYEKASDNSVLLKSLLTGEPGQLLHTGCKFFRSRCNQLHIIRRGENDQADSVFEWNHATMTFEEKFSRSQWKLKTAHRKQDGRLAVVLEDGTAIDITNATPVISGENLADCIEDCRKELGESDYSIERRRRNGKRYTETLEDSTMIHVGYSRIVVSEYGNGDGLFVTKHFRSDASGYSDPSNLHGAVKALSDVVLT